jgi:hypothetical protein
LAPLAAVLVLAAWFFDRADGQLARLQGTTSALGAWLDANVDELHDIAWHVALAFAAASQIASPWPWLLLLSFLGGKYLFMHGLMTEQSVARAKTDVVQGRIAQEITSTHPSPPRGRGQGEGAGNAAVISWAILASSGAGWLRSLYHLPGNADIRIHLLIAALVTGWLTPELALIAIYYNLRWIVRYGLVAHRLRGVS